MSLEATSSQDLIQLVFKGGSLMLNVGKIDMSMVGADGQPVSCFMLRYEDFLTVKDEAKVKSKRK